MENKGKDVTADITQMMTEWKLKEEVYNEMPKDKLINRLIMCEMELEAMDKEATERSIELWYFVSDETGAKFLTDKKPKDSVMFSPGEMDESGVVHIGGSRVWLTDGEINIRVPICMEKLFPEIKYGDEPIKVKLSNVTV